MKNFFTLCIFYFSFFLIPVHAQFYWVNPKPQGHTIYANHFISATTGYLVADGGRILKTTDAGETWNMLTVNSSRYLSDVFFIDASTGYVAAPMQGNTSSSGIILKTTDAGVSWSEITISGAGPIWSVFFIDANTGYLSGENGLILKTTDAGANWATLTSGTTDQLRSIWFKDANNGFILGAGRIIKTTDAGATWTSQNVCGATCEALHDLHFVDANTGYVVGGAGRIYRTANGGTSWSNAGILSPIANTIFGVRFIDANNGYVIGDGGVFKTSNGGGAWTAVTPSDWTGRTIYQVNGNIWIAAGSNGKIYRTTDETNWNTLASGKYEHLTDIDFSSSNTGYAVGWNGTILKTTDQGETWTDISVANNAYDLENVDFVDDNTGYAVGNSGHENHQRRVELDNLVIGFFFHTLFCFLY